MYIVPMSESWKKSVKLKCNAHLISLNVLPRLSWTYKQMNKWKKGSWVFSWTMPWVFWGRGRKDIWSKNGPIFRGFAASHECNHDREHRMIESSIWKIRSPAILLTCGWCLFPVSVAWSDYESITTSWMPVTPPPPPPTHQVSLIIRWYPFIHLGGARQCDSKASCPRMQHDGRCQKSNPADLISFG